MFAAKLLKGMVEKSGLSKALTREVLFVLRYLFSFSLESSVLSPESIVRLINKVDFSNEMLP